MSDNIDVQEIPVENNEEKLLGGCHSCSANSITTLALPTPLTEFFRISLRGGCVSKGVGMRNLGYGTINLTTTEIPLGSTIEKAFLYWAVMPPAGEQALNTGKFNGNDIVGTLIGTPTAPCWDFLEEIDVFRAEIDPLLVNIGSNNLTDFPSGVVDGTPPVDNQTPPLIDGASLVVIFRNPSFSFKTIIINDGGDTIFTFPGSVSTTFNNIQPIATPVTAETTYIVADGQLRFPLDRAIFNTQTIAGPGSVPPLKPEDAFDGSDGSSIAGYQNDGLWDTLTVDVSNLINPGDLTATAEIINDTDCLTYVAQVLCIDSVEATRGINFIDLKIE